MSKLDQAIMLATEAHAGQIDKAGLPYILHPLAVMLRMTTDADRIVAVLHDVVEDTSVTLEEISQQFGRSVAVSVDALTHRKGERNVEYWQRIKDHGQALRVKREDIGHNLSLDRMEYLHPREQDRLQEKYRKALDFLDS
jgi:guanosine-3',5'-bis(diphosphate) 3'-pyrophosphohydrolase